MNRPKSKKELENSQDESSLLNINLPSTQSSFDFVKKPPTIVKQPKVFLAALSAYKTHYRNFSQQITNSIKSNNFAQSKALLHTLKGSSANLGMHLLYDSVSAVEQSLNIGSACDSVKLNDLLALLALSLKDAGAFLDCNEQYRKVVATRSYNSVRAELLDLLTQSKLISQPLICEYRSCALLHESSEKVESVTQALESFEYERAIKLLQ